MSDPITGPEIGSIFANGLIKRCHACRDQSDNLLWNTAMKEKASKFVASKHRFKESKGEPPTKCVVHDRKRAIGSVHHTEQIQIVWNKEPWLTRLRIRQRRRPSRTPFVIFDK